MAQIYFLVIIANIVAGLSLSSGYLGKRIPIVAIFDKFREGRKTPITVGIATTIIGILKLIVRSPGETTPVAGDLAPALIGILLGVVLLNTAFQPKPATNNGEVEKAEKAMIRYRVPIGIIGIVGALVHFLFPGVLIL